MSSIKNPKLRARQLQRYCRAGAENSRLVSGRDLEYARWLAPDCDVKESSGEVDYLKEWTTKSTAIDAFLKEWAFHVNNDENFNRGAGESATGERGPEMSPPHGKSTGTELDENASGQGTNKQSQGADKAKDTGKTEKSKGSSSNADPEAVHDKRQPDPSEPMPTSSKSPKQAAPQTSDPLGSSKNPILVGSESPEPQATDELGSSRKPITVKSESPEPGTGGPKEVAGNANARDKLLGTRYGSLADHPQRAAGSPGRGNRSGSRNDVAASPEASPGRGDGAGENEDPPDKGKGPAGPGGGPPSGSGRDPGKNPGSGRGESSGASGGKGDSGHGDTGHNGAGDTSGGGRQGESSGGAQDAVNFADAVPDFDPHEWEKSHPCNADGNMPRPPNFARRTNTPAPFPAPSRSPHKWRQVRDPDDSKIKRWAYLKGKVRKNTLVFEMEGNGRNRLVLISPAFYAGAKEDFVEGEGQNVPELPYGNPRDLGDTLEFDDVGFATARGQRRGDIIIEIDGKVYPKVEVEKAAGKDYVKTKVDQWPPPLWNFPRHQRAEEEMRRKIAVVVEGDGVQHATNPGAAEQFLRMLRAQQPPRAQSVPAVPAAPPANEQPAVPLPGAWIPLQQPGPPASQQPWRGQSVQPSLHPTQAPPFQQWVPPMPIPPPWSGQMPWYGMPQAAPQPGTLQPQQQASQPPTRGPSVQPQLIPQQQWQKFPQATMLPTPPRDTEPPSQRPNPQVNSGHQQQQQQQPYMWGGDPGGYYYLPPR
jgi:hypothetical protein